MALYAVEGSRLPAAWTTAYDHSDEEEDDSDYYGTEDADISRNGSRRSGSSSSLTYTSTALSSSSRNHSTLAADLGLKPPRPSDSSVSSFVETVFDFLYDPKQGGSTRQLTASELDSVQRHWNNYDIHKSLRPKLLPEEEHAAALKLLYGFRVFYSKYLKKFKQKLSDDRIKQRHALTIQCAYRQFIARRMRGQRLKEQKKELLEQRQYTQFKQDLLQGIPLFVFDPKTKTKREAVMVVDIGKPKILAVRLQSGRKFKDFDLMSLHTVSPSFGSPQFKAIPLNIRGKKDMCFSLHGKGELDMAAMADKKDKARYHRDDFVNVFNLLVKEINSPASIYRDAHGNPVRVVKSVFAPEENVVISTAKEHDVQLKGKNMAALYAIQHRFLQHKQRIQRNQQHKAKQGIRGAATAAAAATTPAGKRGRVDEEEESIPSSMTGVTLMTDERNYQAAGGAGAGRRRGYEAPGTVEEEDSEEEDDEEYSGSEIVSEEGSEDDSDESEDEDGGDQLSTTEYTIYPANGAAYYDEEDDEDD